MRTDFRQQRLRRIMGFALLGIAVAGVYAWLQPLDTFLLDRWERELATLPDSEVRGRIEQIAAIGDGSLPVLVAALHSDRPTVAVAAASVLEREVRQLELLSVEESTPTVTRLASALAKHARTPGRYSGGASSRIATRLLLWPIDRQAGDGEQLVADCELTIRAASTLPKVDLSQFDVVVADQSDSPIAEEQAGSVSLPTTIEDVPPLVNVAEPSATALNGSSNYSVVERQPTTPEPQPFIPTETPRVLTAQPEVANQTPISIDAAPNSSTVVPKFGIPTVRPDPRVLPDLEVMRLLVARDESLAREAVNELYRRGFRTKHVRLAEVLVDRDPAVRLKLVQSLPQMSGIDSRPWLLWLSRDPDPAVRKAAVSIIATSNDPALQERVRELEREETDDDVLQVVRQVINGYRTNSLR